jgi:hypothetical protein
MTGMRQAREHLAGACGRHGESTFLCTRWEKYEGEKCVDEEQPLVVLFALCNVGRLR